MAAPLHAGVWTIGFWRGPGLGRESTGCGNDGAAWNAALLSAGISDIEFGPIPECTSPDEPGTGRLTLIVYSTY